MQNVENVHNLNLGVVIHIRVLYVSSKKYLNI